MGIVDNALPILGGFPTEPAGSRSVTYEQFAAWLAYGFLFLLIFGAISGAFLFFKKTGLVHDTAQKV